MSRYAWSGVVLLCAVLPLSVHAQVLEQLIASALASHPSAQGQRALVQSAEALSSPHTGLLVFSLGTLTSHAYACASETGPDARQYPRAHDPRQPHFHSHEDSRVALEWRRRGACRRATPTAPSFENRWLSTPAVAS